MPAFLAVEHHAVPGTGRGQAIGGENEDGCAQLSALFGLFSGR